MRALVVLVSLVGSTIQAAAGDIDSDYRAYIDQGPSLADRTKPKSLRTKRLSVDDADPRHFGDAEAPRRPDPLKPGYRNPAGIYVPPTYSTHPQSPGGDGFGSSASEPYGGFSAPNPFGGTLGTRR